MRKKFTQFSIHSTIHSWKMISKSYSHDKYVHWYDTLKCYLLHTCNSMKIQMCSSFKKKHILFNPVVKGVDFFHYNATHPYSLQLH